MSFDKLDEVIANAINHSDKKDTKYLVDWAERVVANLGATQLLKQYVQHIARRYAHNTRPEHAIGEQLWAVLQLAGVATGRLNAEAKLLHFDRELPSFVASTFAYFVLQAQVYLWSDKCETIADAAPLPKHVISRNLLPQPIMFWSRQRGYIVHEPERFETNWLLVMHCVNRLRILHDRVYTQGETEAERKLKRVEFVLTDLPYGVTWPDDVPAGEWRDETGRLLKRCAFLASPYTTHVEHGLPRHIRRQMQRAGERPLFEQNQASVRVVELRRESVKHEPTGEHREVDWRHQWWVTGHYRAQWYASEQAHKVIWIAPYLKGPEDKPIIDKIYSVVR